MLEAVNLSKEINGNKILENIDLTLLPGQITALLGPNGSGKSTLLRALSLVDPPNTGRLTIDNQDYNFPNGSNQNLLWPKLTVVFQQHFLWPHLTIEENILLAARANKIKDLDIEYEDLCATLKLKDFLKLYPNQISGGQRQRAALARALILKPNYLLLDEITAALDIEQTKEILNYLPMLKSRGVGILIITHLVSLAKSLADKVVFLDKGRVVIQGSALEVLEDDRVKEFIAWV